MPFDPTQLKCLLAWYNLGQPSSSYTQTNCAKFIRTTSSYLSLTAANSTWLNGLSKLTIAVDVLLNDVSVQQGLVTRWTTNLAQFILRCNGSGALILIVASSLTDAGANYVITGNNVLQSGLPARVVAVYNQGSVSIYVNGNLVTTTVTGTIPGSLTNSSATQLLVGADFNASNFLDGLMSRACIWAGTALTAAGVAADFNWWVGRDPAGCGEPFTPTHAWRLDEASGTRNDCIGTLNLTDANSNLGSEAHISQVNDLSGNGFHARIRPINGPTLVSSGLNGNPIVKHVAANGQFLVSGIALPGLKSKPYAWSLYAVAMATSTSAPTGQASNGLINTFPTGGTDTNTWLVCVLGDTGGSGAPAGSFGMGCGDESHYNQANSAGSTYSANTWFHITGIFPGGVAQVNTWFNGASKTMNLITGAQTCECYGTVHQLVIGAATAEGSGPGGAGWDGGVRNNDFLDGQWADIAICIADTTSQRTDEETWQKTYGGLPA